MDEPILVQESSGVTVLPGRESSTGGPAALVGAHRELPDLTVLDLFERRAASDPEAVAVVSDGRPLTYRELAAAAARVSGGLSGRGIGRGRVVAVAAGRSAAALAGMLAVWRIGAVYLPIDPAYPAERIALLLDDAGAAAVVTERGFAAAMPAGIAAVIAADQAREPDALAAAGPRSAVASPGDAAYVIYTSGSAGKPKGVAVSHRSLLNVVLEMIAVLECGPGDRWTTMAPTTFDVSLLELCVPMVSGARLVMTRESDLRDANALIRLIQGSGVTRMQAVPAQWRMLLDAGFHAPDMVAMVGGEALSSALASALRSRVRTLINGYGPTETAIVSTYWPVPQSPSQIAIGGPIANTRLYLLDEQLNGVQLGQSGELYIAGTGVAQGYLNRPDLTAQHFLPDPYGPPGGRMYRTGDRCRQLPAGTLEYLGRDDGQVKVRGQRIELGEVEARLATHPAVAAVAALVRGDALVACVVAAPNSTPDPAELRAYAAQALPAGAVPSALVLRPELPLTRNGKVDRTALHTEFAAADAAPGSAEAAARAAGDGSEADAWLRSVCDICREVVGVPEVKPEDDLFELGAHSLTVIQLAARMRTVWEVEVPTDLFYEAATVADVAVSVRRLVARQ